MHDRTNLQGWWRVTRWTAVKGEASFVFWNAVKARIVISFPGRRKSVLGAFVQIIPDLHAPEKK
jgi:hypothetical protein